MCERWLARASISLRAGQKIGEGPVGMLDFSGIEQGEDAVESKSSSDVLTKILAAVAGLLFVAVIGLLAFVLGRETAPDSGGTTTVSATSSEYDYSVLNEI